MLSTTEDVIFEEDAQVHLLLTSKPSWTCKSCRSICAERGGRFLVSDARQFYSHDSAGSAIHENFAPMLIFELTGMIMDAYIVPYKRLFNFLHEPKGLPCDQDTTAIALSTLNYADHDTLHSILDEMSQNCNSDGVIHVYFDKNRPRLDPVVCVNVLAVFYQNGRGEEVRNTHDYAYRCLLNRDYLHGTRYYTTPECFLYFAARFLRLSGSEQVKKDWEAPLRERIEERLGRPGDSLAYAMRLHLCKQFSLKNCSLEAQALLDGQGEDGSWRDGWVYQYPSSGLLIGNVGLTTSFALTALKGLEMGPSIQH